MMGNAAALSAFLAAQAGAAVVLTVREIEGLIGAPLPAAADTRDWWTNDPTVAQARAWLDAGWRVRMMQRQKRQWAVIFERTPARSPRAPDRPSPPRPRS